MKLKFSVKQILFIVGHLFNAPADVAFEALAATKVLLKDTTLNDDEEAEIEVSPELVVFIFKTLAVYPANLVAEFNDGLRVKLLPQLMEAGEPGLQVLGELQSFGIFGAEYTALKIEEGRYWINK